MTRFFYVFHSVMIAYLLALVVCVSACGYKNRPYYSEESNDAPVNSSQIQSIQPEVVQENEDTF
ncbi:hypothetical protein [Helicobacter himalayensis]|uniref:hypothetical protein n=1 Tax=Helicobacter himalayensis TaxID=1591088 RepID=UPI0008354E3A|nr:hypothetical protein [Helicobacter himalayensis]